MRKQSIGTKTRPPKKGSPKQCERIALYCQSLVPSLHVPNGFGSSPIYRFLHGSQLLQMTKMPLGSLHSLETTNFGYNGNMPFLVLQVDDLLEGLVGLLMMSILCHVLSFGPLLNTSGISFIASFA